MDLSRRKFLRVLGLGAAAVPLTAVGAVAAGGRSSPVVEPKETYLKIRQMLDNAFLTTPRIWWSASGDEKSFEPRIQVTSGYKEIFTK